MIIDCHTHVNCYDETNPRTLPEMAQSLFDEMAANGVDHAVVLS